MDLGRLIRRQLREAFEGAEGARRRRSTNVAAAVNVNSSGHVTSVYSDEHVTIVQRDGETQVIHHDEESKPQDE